MKACWIAFGVILFVYPVASCALQSEPDLLVKVRIHFSGPNPLPVDVQEQIAKDFEGKIFNSTLARELEERVREECREQGYFRALVRSTVEMADTFGEHKAIVGLDVDEGQQYRLADIRWKNLTAFRPNDLRPLFPLQNGEIFDVRKVRQGLDAVRKIYATKGYINFIAVPDSHIDDAARTISLDIDLDEGGVFTVRSMRVLGEDNTTREAFLNSLKPGDVFNPMRLQRVFELFRSRFPKDREIYNVVETVRDDTAHAVDVIVDLRSLD